MTLGGIVKASGLATVAAGTPGVRGSIAVAVTNLVAGDNVIVTISSSAAQDINTITFKDTSFEVIKTAGTGFTVYAVESQNPEIDVDYVVLTAGNQTTKIADEDIENDYITQLELDGSGANVELTKLTAIHAGQRIVIWCSDSSNTVSVTCIAGTTFNGTNTIATFDAASDYLELVALSTTEFAVVQNVSVVLSGP